MLNSADIQTLVTKAFVLEAISDKPGCTSRYHDIPGKPLQDFIIAGINSAPFLAKVRMETDAPIFEHNLAALQASNTHKSDKYLNFGLLEILFPTVYARVRTDDQDSIVTKIIEHIQSTSRTDVAYLIATRELAWSTSATPHKLIFNAEKYAQSSSVWDFYVAYSADSPADSSNYQWAQQYQEGLPILRAFHEAYRASGEIMNTTKKTFESIREQYPALAIGIIADMCAAAIFLWLSFNQTNVG